MQLHNPVAVVPMVGTSYVRRLEKLNIRTVADLLWHTPIRHDDLRTLQSIAKAPLGIPLTIEGALLSIKNVRAHSGLWLTKALMTDGSGTLELVWFNQPYLANSLKNVRELSVSGSIETDKGKPVMRVPSYEPKGQHIHTGRLVPVYSETSGISSKWLRSRIFWLLTHFAIDDWMPEQWRLDNDLIDLAHAFRELHFPSSENELTKARRRLGLEELLGPQIQARLKRDEWETQGKAPAIHLQQHGKSIADLIGKLPFSLTGSQHSALNSIFSDMAKTKPMNRLLQGDVGSGKTVVSAICLFLTWKQGLDGIFMAPTEILAQQHARSLETILKSYPVPIKLLTGSTRKFTQSKEPSIYIGTHALLGKRLEQLTAGLVVIDEQHKFGVAQRALLRSKTGNPHILTMTATPIPRTIALSLYGNLAVSYMDNLSLGRLPIKTYVVPTHKKTAAYEFIRKEIQKDRQVFIICPFIDPSETLQGVRAATTEFESISTQIFPKVSCGLIHGKLTSAQKQHVLNRFYLNELKILVATPVVEVGIDVPNATVMAIEGAERFGLAQLHQLRGRVGRGKEQSYCLLFIDQKSQTSKNRLDALAKLNLGREVAELDLGLRGPGELYGFRQHGLPNFKLANLLDDKQIELAQHICNLIMHNPQVMENPCFPIDPKKPVDPN